VLTRISLVMLYMHKLQIMTSIDKKYYDNLTDVKPAPVNGAKTYIQRIGMPQGPLNVKYVLSPNGTDDIRRMQRKRLSHSGGR
jgi:hypothetical protein